MESVDRIDELEKLFTLGFTTSEIWKLKHISHGEINQIIDALNNPGSKIYDPERYKYIMNLKKQNHTRAWYRDNGYNSKKYRLAQEFSNGTISLQQAASYAKMGIIAFLIYLNQIHDSELSIKLQPILKDYGFEKKEEKSTKSLKEYPKNVIKEIVLMALTYRVSFKTIAKKFNTTILDVAKVFLTSEFNTKSIDYLFLETYNENEFHEKKAYNDAMIYWHERNKLIKSLNEAEKNKEKKKVTQIKIQLDLLRSKIDDRYINKLIGKQVEDLTQEERDLIARFQLKYYMSSRNCANYFGYATKTIRNCSARLAERNMIFAEKMVLHDSIYQERNQAYSYREQYNAEISRGGGSR